MTYLAENIDSIIESESYFEPDYDCEVFEVEFRDRESLSENFNDEIEAWARHSIAANGFGDY